MSRIIKVLKQAVRYARGDKSAGKATTVIVARHPSYETLMEMAKASQGEWVSSDDMDPISNVAGRVYRTKAGDLGIYAGYPPRVPVEAWFYPRSV